MKPARIVLPKPADPFADKIAETLARRQAIANREPKKQSMAEIVVQLRALAITIERQARA